MNYFGAFVLVPNEEHDSRLENVTIHNFILDLDDFRFSLWVKCSNKIIQHFELGGQRFFLVRYDQNNFNTLVESHRLY